MIYVSIVCVFVEGPNAGNEQQNVARPLGQATSDELMPPLRIRLFGRPNNICEQICSRYIIVVSVSLDCVEVFLVTASPEALRPQPRPRHVKGTLATWPHLKKHIMCSTIYKHQQKTFCRMDSGSKRNAARIDVPGQHIREVHGTEIEP